MHLRLWLLCIHKNKPAMRHDIPEPAQNFRTSERGGHGESSTAGPSTRQGTARQLRAPKKLKVALVTEPKRIEAASAPG
jgi:hypothetical protein